MHSLTVAARRWRVGCIALTVAVVGMCASPALAQTKLRWKFQAGEKVNYEMNMVMVQSMNFGDQPINTKVSQLMNMTWQAKEVADDGTAVMEQTIDRIRVEIVPPGADPTPIKYDSQSKEQAKGTEMLAPLFGAMVGQPMTLTVTPLGEVRDIVLAPGCWS